MVVWTTRELSSIVKQLPPMLIRHFTIYNKLGGSDEGTPLLSA